MSGDTKRSMDPAVLAAIITVVGGIVVTLITTFANRPTALPDPTVVPTWTVAPTATMADTPVPTDAVAAGEPTSTPAPDTPTPEPTFTPTPPPIGADWANNCISGLWKPYPPSITAEQKDGCIVQLVDKFYTTEGRLAFTFSERVSGAQIYGLFAPLPTDGTASIKFKLKSVIKGEVLIGIFAAPDVNSDGLFLVIPEGKGLDEQRMLIRTMPNKKTFAQTGQPIASASAEYDAFFDFNSGNVTVKLKDNQVNLGTVTVVSSEKWLFIGYQVLNGTNNVQAEFFDLAVQSR